MNDEPAAVTYRTVVLDVPTTILGLLPGVLILEHWCNLCRRQVDTDLLVDHARGHYDAQEAGL